VSCFYSWNFSWNKKCTFWILFSGKHKLGLFFSIPIRWRTLSFYG
jgi:hypothetical protein